MVMLTHIIICKKTQAIIEFEALVHIHSVQVHQFQEECGLHPGTIQQALTSICTRASYNLCPIL